MKVTRLKRVLFEANVVHADIAAAVGISESALSRYVNGRRPIPEDTRRRLADVLQVQPADLMEETVAEVGR